MSLSVLAEAVLEGLLLFHLAHLLPQAVVWYPSLLVTVLFRAVVTC
jgi:hypothetical protein